MCRRSDYSLFADYFARRGNVEVVKPDVYAVLADQSRELGVVVDDEWYAAAVAERIDFASLGDKRVARHRLLAQLYNCNTAVNSVRNLLGKRPSAEPRAVGDGVQ